MKLEALELLRLSIPLRSPFRTTFSSQATRSALLLHAITDIGEGWSECTALPSPLYSSEYIDAAEDVIRHHLFPRLVGEPTLTPARVGEVLKPVKGHRMAKAALETAVLDAHLRAAGMRLSDFLGGVRDRVPAGVSVGIMDTIPELLDNVDGYLAEGYVRIKLKIQAGWDVEPVAAVRERFGDDLALQVDANTAYTLGDWRTLAKLDPFDLLLVEQPLDEEDLRGHAELAKLIRTPICLDESIVSARAAADALALRACSIVNIKPARVGGYLESRRIHDVCVANDVPVWCGGMLETGIGRAANAALAALPGFTLAGDVSASDRYYSLDITEPFRLRDGYIDVPGGPGIGVDPIADVVASYLTSSHHLPAD